MNSRITIAIAVSAGMALLVTGLFYQMALRGGPSGAPTALTELVVAVTDLEIGSTLQPADLRLEPWPADRLPPGAQTAIEEVIGRVPNSRILSGEPLLERRLAAPGSGVGLATKVPAGMRAMSVRVDDVNGVAGFVVPEARVDVLITGVPRSRPSGGRVTRTILGNVRVLSAGENLAPDATGKPQRVPVVTLLLTPEQAEMVTLAQTQGRIQLVLRNSGDERVAESSGIGESQLFGGVEPTINVSKPAARPRLAVMELPAPEPIEIEVIRGDRRTVQSFNAAESR